MEEDTQHALTCHSRYHREMLSRLLPEDQIGRYLRYRHASYMLESDGVFTPELSICGKPPVVIHSEADRDGLNHGKKVERNGYLIVEYDNHEGGHYKCGKLARENPGISVFSMCGCEEERIVIWKYDTLGNPVPISRDEYEKRILQNVNLTEFEHKLELRKERACR